MKFFVCLLDPEKRGVPETTLREYESLPRSRGYTFQRWSTGAVSMLTGGDDDDAATEPWVVADGNYVAVGTVRLDNRAELERWSTSTGPGLSDLELVLRTVAQYGTKYVPRFLGDFAFVVWNACTRTAVAACDAFAVRKLYCAEWKGLFAFASRAEMLALDGRYDVQYLAERIATCIPTPELSPYVGVKSIPASTVAVLQNGRLTTREYWSTTAFQVEPALARAEHEAAETCRHLLAESVRLRLSCNGDTWAQLSGGMDSSSVVSVTQWLATSGMIPRGLAGTVTFADSHGTGADEREFSQAVVRCWRVRNETIVDSPVWHDDQFAPPYTDEPSPGLPVHPRNHRLCAIVRGAGGRVLLTGVGGDELFTGNMFFFADWVVQGRVWAAVREMARRATMGRVSFWELAYRNALLPLLPRSLQYHLVRDDGQMPPWVVRSMVRRHGLHTRAIAPAAYAGRIGRKYVDGAAMGVEAVRGGLLVGLIEDTLDVRHPFLYRPLVEFALSLPPELRVRPNARKWVLREAMRGILPEAVRTRVGKGVIVGLLAWSMANQQSLLQPLVEDPILADLGIIDAGRLRKEFVALQRERANRERRSAALHYTLAVEAWLRMRSGRWPSGSPVSSGNMSKPFNLPSA